MNAEAIFNMRDRNNKLGITGKIFFHQCNPNSIVRVKFDLHNLSPNQTRAIHIHEKSISENQDCMSAGPHWNPYNKEHGSIWIDAYERHAGDLINNLTSDSNGNFKYVYCDPLLTLYGNNSIIGRSVIIHEKQDDLGLGNNEDSKKTGNAGGRVACSNIYRV